MWGTSIRRMVYVVVAAAVAASVAIAAATAAGATPRVLTKFCPPGAGAGQCDMSSSGGVAIDSDGGAIYLANQNNRRLEKFGPWGEFLMAWGWGVRTGSPQPETCGPVAQPPSPTCEVGLDTDRAGGFDRSLATVAVDSTGAVYTFEAGTSVGGGNFRVQKFTPSGEFVLEFGGEVNETTSENICTAASGDDCGPGTEGFAAGFFAPGYVCSSIGTCTVSSNRAQVLAVGPDDRVYVGDRQRIQVFADSGAYETSIPTPGEVAKALAVDDAGNLYVAFQPKSTASGGGQFQSLPNVQKFSAAGDKLCTAEVATPMAIAAAADGHFYVLNRRAVPVRAGILEFNANCLRTDPAMPVPGFGADLLPDGGGLALGSMCEAAGAQIVATNTLSVVGENNSFGVIFGTPPDPSVCPPPALPPDISDQFAVDVDTSSARVGALINPRFWPDARYYVEYGPRRCSEGGCDAVVPSPSGLPLTQEVVNEAIRTNQVVLTDLEPGTTYYYRFIAESSGGTEIGDERTLRTYPPSKPLSHACANQAMREGAARWLPNCRAYEMVSPVDKNNGDVDPTGEQGIALGAASGQRAVFASFRAFGEPAGAPFSNQYLAERTDNGWKTRSIAAPREQVSMYQGGSPAGSLPFKGFDPELCVAWMVQDNRIPLAPDAPADVPNLYQRQNCPGPSQDTYTLLTTVSPPGYVYEPNESAYFPDPQGGSVDGTRTVFRAPAKLTANACDTKGILQVYEAITGGALHLVSVRPNNQPVCTHSSVGTPQGLPGDYRRSALANAVSEDGRRVFWTASNDADPELPKVAEAVFTGTIYLRANVGGTPVSGEGCLNSNQACTIRVSERVSEQPARFWGADRQGTTAIFSVGATLYRFTTDPSPSATEVAKGLVGVMGLSADASRLYFVSTEALTGAQKNSAGAVAESGKPNLYFLKIGDDPVFVGTLAAGDAETANGVLPTADPSPIAVLPDRRMSRVSGDGLSAVFASTAALTGRDSRDLVSGDPATEVFRYDATAGANGTLTCISCNPSGARSVARRSGTVPVVSRIPGWAEQLRPTRALSEDGDRVYFESYAQLVLRDTNQHQDVYQWERAETDTQCLQEQGGELFVPESEGCLSLISDGAGKEDVSFIDASATGTDVWIATNSSLLPQDPGLYDIYDAREGGGFPAPSSPASSCVGEACQPAGSPPGDPTPASSSFVGPGNVKHAAKSRGCPKGKRKVRRGGKVRCVKAKKGKRAGAKNRKMHKRPAKHRRGRDSGGSAR